MLETSARLLRLLGFLQAHREWSGTALAGRLGVSARTLRRDVEKLRLLGYPIDAIGGVGGGYRLAAGATLPPLLLDDEEAVAVAVGLRTAAAVGVTGIAETSVRALAKLDQVLPSRLRHQVDTLGAAVVTTPTLGPTVHPATLTTIAAAVRDRLRLRFDYRPRIAAGAPPDSEPVVREVEPYRLVHNGPRWYLLGWDVRRGDWRTFRVDRLTPRIPTGPRFTPRPLPAEDLARYLSFAVTTNPYRWRAVLILHAPATEVADEVPPTIGVVEPVDDATCRVLIGSDSLDQLAVWTAAFGFEFEVREPPELIEHLRTLTARLGRASARSDHHRDQTPFPPS